MNDADFESRLSHQPMRPVPDDWRDAILADVSKVFSKEECADLSATRQTVTETAGTSISPLPATRHTFHSPRDIISTIAAWIHSLHRHPARAGIAGLWVMSALFRLASPQVDAGPARVADRHPSLSPAVILMVWEMQFPEFDRKPSRINNPPAARERDPFDRPRSFRARSRATV